MKLIKLNNSTETSGRFTNRFNTPITIEPNSEIALLNCSMNISTENIIVSDSNNSFYLNVSAAISREVVLNNGTYNWGDFRDELQRALNSALSYVDLSPGSYMTGFQLRVSKYHNKLKIAFDRSDNEGYKLNTLSTVNNLTYTDADTKWEKSGGTQDTWDGYVETARYFTAGCGSFKLFTECPAINMGDAEYANYRFCLGLRDVSSLPFISTQRQPSDCEYAIYCDLNTASTANVYYVRYPDAVGSPVIVETAINVTQNHYAMIILSEGKILLHVYNATPTLVVEVEVSLTAEFFKNHYYCVASLRRNGSLCNTMLFVADPYHKASVGLEPEHYYLEDDKDYNGIDDESQLGAIVATRVSLRMTAPVLQLLGFDANPAFQQLIRGSFISEKHIEESYLPDNIKIELDNVKLDAYDSYTKSERNILACIPKIHYNEAETSSITYASDYPVWMSIKNLNAFTLNHIQVSILNYKDEPQKLSENETDLTLLIRDKNNLM